jgi:peptidoglycan/LPS O-acetylase OafA/YrhL
VSRSYVTLDGLRGIAALAIVVLHCHFYTGDFSWSSAALAVDLFFVLSGFVLAYAYEARFRSSMTAVEFIKARLIRLYPLYLIGTLLGIVQALALMRLGATEVGWTWSRFWTSLPFSLVMLPAPDKTLFPFNGVMWSIFFELLINIVWALVWRPLRSTRTLIAVIAVSGAGLATSVYAWGTLTDLGLAWSTFVGGFFRVSYSFFLGVLLFRFHKQLPLPKIPPILLLAALPCVLFLPLPPALQLLAALFIMPWFVLLGSRVEPAGRLHVACAALGAASYASYAVHKRVYEMSYGGLRFVLGIDMRPFAPWIGILFIAALIVACLILNRYFDEPVRRWLSQSLKRPARLASEREGATQAP